MSKKLTRLLCLMLSLFMLISSAACKTKEPEDTSSKPTSSKEVESEISGEVESEEDEIDVEEDDEEIDIGWGNDEIGEITDIGGGFYFPESYHFTHSPYPEELDVEEWPEFEDITEDNGLVFGEVGSPIQKVGEKVSGKDRVFNVDINNVVYDDFKGHGSNVFPVQFMTEARTSDKALRDKATRIVNDVTFELERDRWMAIKGNVYRCWFQVDWITTTEENDPQREDYENNKDYQNYIKGKYDFDSERMKDVYPYLDIWKESGSEIALNFGWKAGTDIQSWFGFPGIAKPMNSAPFDLDAFGRAAAYTVDELRNKRGYDNITMLCFYNEPNLEGDFETYLDQVSYWVLMLQYADKWLEELGIRDQVEIWSCGENSMNANHYEFTDAVKKKGVNEFDVYDGHYYYGRIKEMFENNYSYAFDLFCFFREHFNEHVFYITENYAGTYGVTGEEVEDNGSTKIQATFSGVPGKSEGATEFVSHYSGFYNWWNDSTASFVIAGANAGMGCLLNWGYTGGHLPDPEDQNPASNWDACWRSVDCQPNIEDSMMPLFYETALLTNYIPAHSDVLMVDWTGDDIRGSAFKTSDGDYTILVEANGKADKIHEDYAELVKNTTDRNLTINLKGNKKKLTFYKYHFNYDSLKVDQHATVPTHVETIKATDKITDRIDDTQSTYIYTTIKPGKQIAINSLAGEVNYFVAPGNSIDLSATMLDCDANDEIVWSVSATNKEGVDGKMTGYNGDLSSPYIFGRGNSASYTVPASYNSGDMIAIRASLKSNPSVFDVVIISVGNQ